MTLTLISEIFKILGWVSILGIIFYIIIEGFDMFANFSGSNIEIVIILAGKLLLTFMIPLYLFFTSESIMLFMDIEKNTRK